MEGCVETDEACCDGVLWKKKKFYLLIRFILLLQAYYD